MDHNIYIRNSNIYDLRGNYKITQGIPMKITPELQEAYNKCMYEAYMKKRRCSDKCKICHPDKEEVTEVGEDIKGNWGDERMILIELTNERQSAIEIAADSLEFFISRDVYRGTTKEKCRK